MYVEESKSKDWRVYVGGVTSVSGSLLVSSFGWGDLITLPTCIVLCSFGLVLCVVGFRLLCRITIDDKTPIEVDGVKLGCFQLNGCCLLAYEGETRDGRKRFRLAASTQLTSQREAAIIRYLVLEGFVASLWPQMCPRIEEEAAWAFLV